MFISLLVLVLQSSFMLSTDVEWYISAKGSADVATCGKTAAEPCNSLAEILARSPSFDNGSSKCYLSDGAVAGRDSTTVYFVGEVKVTSVCLMNWTNLRIVGLGDNITITSGLFGGNRGIFECIQCTNVSIENLNFATSAINKATLFFQASMDIRVIECSFYLASQSTLGVQLLHCAGNIALTNNTFYGSGNEVADSLSPLGLDIDHGCIDCSIPFNGESYNFSTLSFTLMITDCTFKDLKNRSPPEDRYNVARGSAAAMRLRFGANSMDNQIFVLGSSYSNIVNSKANSIVLNYEGKSANNTVHFIGCTFRRNRVRYGGGISAYFYNGPVDSRLIVEDSEFVDNVADFEGGGVFVTFLSSGSSNTLQIYNSSFARNSATYGSGLFLLNNPTWFSQRIFFDPVSRSLVTAELVGCMFRNNTASKDEGVINTLRIQLNIYGISNISSNEGSGIVLRLSLLRMKGEFTFSENSAVTGGAINIRDGSRVDLSQVMKGYFVNNSASFQGGAIFADSPSTTEITTEYNHTFAQLILASCFITFGNEIRGIGDKKPRRFTFIGNTATLDGQHIHSFSLRSCLSSNFVPANVDHFFAIPSDGTVYHDVPSDRDPLQSTTTGPNFLFFYGASVKCFKSVNRVTYLLPNCSNNLLISEFYLHRDLTCGILNLTRELQNIYSRPGIGLRPITNELFTPWAAIDASWMDPPESKRAQCPEPIPGNLVLSPAPGEQFDLSVQLADQLLNYVFATVFMQVEGREEREVEALMQLNGLQYGIGDGIYFNPNRPLSGFALVGMPGATGFLKITAQSQIKGQPIILLLPFQLSHCPMGYFLPPTLLNASQVRQMIYTSITQRMPTSPYQPLGCHCFKLGQPFVKFSEQVESLPSECILGYTVSLSGSLWAGLLPRGGDEIKNDGEYPPTILCPNLKEEGDVAPSNIQDSLTSFVLEFRRMAFNTHRLNFDPVDVIPYKGIINPGGGAPVKCFNFSVPEVVKYKSSAIFSIEQCSQGFCQGDSSTTWVVANVSYPCAANRMGALCGQCKPGFAITLYSSVCRDCMDKSFQYYLSLVLTFLFGLLFVTVIIYFNIGVTPIIDSLLFFTQTVYLMLDGRNDYEIFHFMAFFNPNFTFNLCITPNLDALSGLILQYVTPVYILLLLLFILILTRSKCVSRILGQHSILQGLWNVFFISYLNIAIVSFGILYCQKIGAMEINGVPIQRELVLIQDASVRCFKGHHLLFAIIALITLILLILPFPIYTLIIMRNARWKPVADVLCSSYKDKHRWWLSFSLFRRLLLVITAVFFQDIQIRHLMLILLITFILLFQVATWPYKTRIDNSFALFVTWMLLITAIITQPSTYLTIDPQRGISMFLVVLTIFTGIVLLIQETAIRLLEMKSVGQFYKLKVWPSLVCCWKRLVHVWGGSRDSQQGLKESTRSNSSIIFQQRPKENSGSYRESLLDSQTFEHIRIEKEEEVTNFLSPSHTEVVLVDTSDSGFATSYITNVSTQ